MSDIAYVCSDCGASLVRVESPEEPRLTTWACPTHGDRGFFMDVGRLCAECLELIEPDESAVPSRVLAGEPLVHPECSG